MRNAPGVFVGAALLVADAASWAGHVERRGTLAAVLAAAAVVAGATGVVLGATRGTAPAKPARWLTGAVAVAAFFFLAFAALFEWLARSALAEGDPAAAFLGFGRDALVPLGVASAAAVVARAVRSRAADTLMLGAAIGMSPVVPPGTAILVAWLGWVRAQESPAA